MIICRVLNCEEYKNDLYSNPANILHCSNSNLHTVYVKGVTAMKLTIKRVFTIGLISILFAFLAINLAFASTPEPTTIDKMTNFLSNVVGINLPKYSLIQSHGQPTNVNVNLLNASLYPKEFGGQVKVESPVLNYSSSQGQLDTMGIFYNGQLMALRIYSQDKYIYSEQPSTSLIDQSNSILKNYQTFISREYSIDTSYVSSMQNILKASSGQLPTNSTIGNITFQSSKNGNETDFQWIYNQNGQAVNFKEVQLTFINNTFVSFLDTWNIYKVSGPNVLSSSQAYQIALNAAQKYQLNISSSGENGLINVPDLSNAPYQVNFAMLPYRYSTINLPSNPSRDALTLYPLWQFQFYFNKSIAGDSGLQVGVWGDTKEVLYCSGFGYFGNYNSDMNLNQAQSNVDPSIVPAIIGIAAVLSVSLAILISQHKKTKKRM